MAGGGGKILSESLSFLRSTSLRRLSTHAVAAILPPNPPSSAHFSVQEHLVHSFGLSIKEAASPVLAHLQLPDNPDSVLRFLHDRGLTGDEIASFVSRTPRLLCEPVGGELAAKFEVLVGVGFSAVEIAAILQKSNLLTSVSLSNVKKRVDFLRSILDKDADVKKMIKRTLWTLTGGITIERRMVDNIAKLREWGVSTQRIKALIPASPIFFQLESARIDDAASAAEFELGISRRSKMFVHAVVVLSTTKESVRQSKYEVFHSFGWNKSHIFALFNASPHCFALGVATLTKNLDFLMNKAGLSADYIVKCASMLGMSLERKLLPRYELICALKAKKIPSKKLTSTFYTIVSLPVKDFQSKFVDEFMKLEPDACQVYMSSVNNY